MPEPEVKCPVGFGEFILDRARFELRRSDECIYLQPKTFDVLAYLVEHHGEVVKEDLVAAVWPGVIVTDHSLTRCIKDLRRALGDDAAHPRYIETVARRGYRFLATPAPVAQDAPRMAPPAGPVRAARQHLGALAAIILVVAFAAVPGSDVPPSPPTGSFDALQAYQAGEELLQRRPAGWMSRALAAFDRAIAHDARFAAAHAGRAAVLAVGAESAPHRRAALQRARASAATALGLDPGCALAHAALGFVQLQEGDASRAERTLREAIARDPKLGTAWNWLGLSLTRQGRRGESLAAYEAGVRADPLHPSLLANIGIHYAAHARYAEARTSHVRLQQLPYPTFQAQRALFDVALAQGRLAEALELSLESEALSEGALRGSAKLNTSLILARLGFAEGSRARLQEGIEEDMTWRALHAADRILGTLGASAEMHALAARLDPAAGRSATVEAVLARTAIVEGDVVGGVERLARALEGAVHMQFGGWGDDPARLDQRLALAYGMQRLGRGEAARTEIRSLLAEHARAAAQGLGKTPEELALRALALGLAGERLEALQAIELAVAGGWVDCFRAAHDPRWDALRSEQRFQDAMARARLAVERERSPARIRLASAPPPN